MKHSRNFTRLSGPSSWLASATRGPALAPAWDVQLVTEKIFPDNGRQSTSARISRSASSASRAEAERQPDPGHRCAKATQLCKCPPPPKSRSMRASAEELKHAMRTASNVQVPLLVAKAGSRRDSIQLGPAPGGESYPTRPLSMRRVVELRSQHYHRIAFLRNSQLCLRPRG